VLGLKIVLMDGEIVEIGGPYLDSEGYDFLALIVGSEGQFGIITEATLRILPTAATARPVMLGFSSCEAAGQCVAGIIGSGIIPVAIEYMDKPAIAVCEAYAKAGYPLDVEALLIVEVEGFEDEIARLLRDIVEIARAYDPKVIEASTSAEHSARIWKGRKAAFGAMGRISDYYCMDGTIPLGRLPEVLGQIAQICAAYRLKVANVFHAGDGNLHPLILYNANDADEARRAELAGAEILKLCVAVGGCLTGEHGVGIEKRDLMEVQFSPSDLAVQMRIKSVFDPQWLLNPGKVFPLGALESAERAAADQAA
jgi:glycolate oxidase